MRITLYLVIPVVMVLLVASTAAADNNDLMQRVHTFLYQQVHEQQQEPERIDEILIDLHPPSPHLPPCINPAPFLPNPQQTLTGRFSVGVRCGQHQQQIRYLQAEVDIMGPYVVAANDIARGTLMTPDMLATQRGNLGKLSSRTLTEASDVVGTVTRRPIRRGSVFQANDLQAPRLVERGQRVTVVAKGTAFQVTREGEAMDNGGLGERVRVRFGSREILEARVIDTGVLQVGF